MTFIDDLIVTWAVRFLRGAIAVGTGLLYVQFFVLAMAVVIAVAVMLVAGKFALSGD